MTMNKDVMNEVFDKSIYIRNFYGPFHPGASIYPVRNPITGDFPYCVRQVDHNKNIIYDKNDNPGEYFVRVTDKIFIKDGEEFDLTNEISRKKWDAIKFSNLIWDSKGVTDENGRVVVSPSESPSSDAIFYVERVVDAAKKRNTKARLRNQAQNFIYQDSFDKLALKAMVLGKYVKSSSREEIEEYMVEQAQSNPERVIDLYTGSDLKLHLMFIYAKEKNILVNKNGIFFFGDSSIIGRNEDSCVAFFKNPANKLITEQIEKEVLKATVEYEEGVRALNTSEVAEEGKEKATTKK